MRRFDGARAALMLVALSTLSSLAGGGCSHDSTTAEETAAPPAAVAVAVVPVSTAAVARVADLVGTLFANEEVTIASQLERARVVWIGPDMGDRVEAGAVIVRLDDADVLAELREVEASLAKARADNKRAQTLQSEGIMSAGEAERMGTDAAVFEARRDLLKVRLDRTVIRTPLPGSIATRHVSAGEVVQIGQPLYRIVQDDPLKFRTAVPERFAGFLRVGLEARLRVDAYPDRPFVSRVTRINPTSDTANRSIVIEALVENHDGLLKPGFFASGDLVYDTAGTALVVPERALTTFAGVTKLYVVKDGKAEERVVQTGIAVPEGRREIVSGVAAGEQVAVSAVEKLEHGVPVSVSDQTGEPVTVGAPEPVAQGSR